MRTSRTLLAVAFIGAIAAAVAGFLIFSPPGSAPDLAATDVPRSSQAAASSTEAAKLSTPKMERPAVEVDRNAPALEQVAGSAEPIAPPGATHSPTTRKAPYQPGPSKFKNATDPRARTVLARVGADFDAEVYWLSAINDPSTPANERKDLIEDLNEDGISDPARPTRQDLPLITSRIELIERLLPSAKDKVNADAFREAHKDLVKMRDRLEE